MSLLTQTARSVFCGLVAMAGLALLAPSAALAGEMPEYDPLRHDRFLRDASGFPIFALPNPTFLLSPYEVTGDLSGVAVGTRGAILISPQHILTAAHFPTTSPSFRGADGIVRTFATDTAFIPLTSVPDGMGGFTQVPSDVMILRLTTPVDTNLYSPLPILVGEPGDFLGAPLYVFDQFDRAGQNTIDGVQLAQFAGSPPRPTWTVAHQYLVSGTNPDRIGLGGGDSSHAALAIGEGGVLGLVGSHFAVTSLTGDRVNFSSLAAPYLDQIQAFVGQDNFTVMTVVIPEPGMVAFIGLAALALTRRRAA